eukprot:scaffold119416_cov18-Tisochrysis_lutea.AAC.1
MQKMRCGCGEGQLCSKLPRTHLLVVSTAVSYYTRGLPPLTFSCGGKVPADYWGGKKSGETELVFHRWVLDGRDAWLCGIQCWCSTN